MHHHQQQQQHHHHHGPTPNQQQVLIRELDRLTLSVHYASTPALADKNGGGGGGNKANSVEENSVNSEDCEVRERVAVTFTEKLAKL